MEMKNLGGVEIKVDADGFLQEWDKWTKEVAEDLAVEEKASPMTEEHWKLVDFLREFYGKFKIAPPIQMLCKQTGVSLKRVNELFPSGPAGGNQGGRSACKVAGLPKPTGCV